MNDLESAAMAAATLIYERFLLLLKAPLNNQDMLWSAIPLVIATVFITLYFGRHKDEELGWNTAFGNTMIFMFSAISVIRQIYTSPEVNGSHVLLVSNFNFLVASVLVLASISLMIITYFHILPKRVAFFLFSAIPMNASLYVVMTIIYAKVPSDLLTLSATLLLVLLLVIIAKVLRFVVWHLIGERKSEPAALPIKTKPLASGQLQSGSPIADETQNYNPPAVQKQKSWQP